MTAANSDRYLSGENQIRTLLALAETINAAMSYQEVLEAVAPILPDCQGVYLNLWEHFDCERATYLEVVAAASITETLSQSIGHRFAKADYPFADILHDERLIVVENVQTDPQIDRISRANYELIGTRAFVRVPFIREGRRLGALFFKYNRPRHFAEHERLLALGIADLALAAVERIRLLQETAAAVEAEREALVAEQEAREELGLLYKASEAVQAADTFQEIIQAVAPLARRIETIYLVLWEHLDYRKATYFEMVAGINSHCELPAAVGQRFTEAQFPIVGKLTRTRQLVIEDIHDHPLVDPLTLAGWEADGVQALLIVNLIQDDRWYGVITFESSIPRHYTEKERRLTLTISDLVLSAAIRIQSQLELSAAIEAQRDALRAEQAAREEMAQLYQVSKTINQATDMEQVLAAIDSLFPDPVDVAIFAWEHYDRSRANCLECIASSDANLAAGVRLPRDIVTGAATLESGKLLIANDVNGPEWVDDPAVDSARFFGLHSIAFTNLTHSQQVRGLFAIASYQPYHFSPQETRLMMAMADLTAAALERFRSRQAEQAAMQEREELFRASQAINAANSFHDILEAVRHIDFDGGDHYLYMYENFDSRTATYIETVATSGDRFMTQGMRIPLEQLPFLKSQPRPGLGVYENVAEDPNLDEVTKTTMLSHGTFANLRFGLVWHGRLLGSYGVDHPVPKKYTDRERRLMIALGELISAAVERIRLQGEMYAARERAERLAEQAQQLAALEERTHLARELHDSVSQALYGIGLGAQTAQRHLDNDTQLARESVDYILTLAQAGLAEMRALIFELRPESLEMEGLVIALAKQAASLQARHQIDVQLELGVEPTLPLTTKESLYRVLREALHNVIKHAGATQVVVRMQNADNGVLCEVIDNGVGFVSTQEFPGHLGLKSMRERVTHLGGAFSIDAAPGQGTRLTVTLPQPAPFHQKTDDC